MSRTLARFAGLQGRHRFRLLEDGFALRGDVVARVRGRRTQRELAAAAGLGERTLHRIETQKGATLTQAYALIGAEFAAGNIGNAVYLVDMIGETLELAPNWATARPDGWPR